MTSVFPCSVSSPLHSLLLPPYAGHICDIAWSPLGTHLAAVSSAGWVFVWDSDTGKLLHQKQITRTPLLSVAWARQGTCLAVGCQKGVLRMLDEHLGVCAVHPFSSPVTRIAWAPHVVGACAIVTGQSVTILREEKPTTRVLRYHSAVLDAAWSGDGRQIAILCANGLVEIWQVRRSRLDHQFSTEPMAGGSLLWDQACHTITVVGAAGSLYSYPLLESRPVLSSPPSVILSPLPGTAGRRWPVQDPSGRYLAATSPHAVLLYTTMPLP
jgi:WD40 repeat protein